VKNTENCADTTQISGEHKIIVATNLGHIETLPDNEEDCCDGITTQAGALPWINVHYARHDACSAGSQISFNLIIISRR
jgi:hypothetical protein